MRKTAVFGSTGSIGTQVLDIIRKNGDSLSAHLLTAGSNLNLIAEQIKEFEPKYAVLPDNEEARKFELEFSNTFFFYGEAGLAEAAEKCDYDFMLNSLLGVSGFIPTYNALKTGRSVALANKETLVAGGNIIMDLAKKNNLDIIPVDSEHSAIFQCLQNEGNKRSLKKITLTASGGPFRGMNREQLGKISRDDALKHPNWTMGNKITIDSATLMNKGFEIIEAKWLFGLEPKQIDVVVHPESIIHSMVEFADNSTLAQMGQPDMTIPISYAFSYPYRWDTTAKSIDLIKTGTLNFSKPDYRTFKLLGIAIKCLKAVGSYPIVLNAANEVMVALFLEGRIDFLQIGDIVENILDAHISTKPTTPEEVLAIDSQAREDALRAIK